ncbi:polyphosphate kinase 2 [Rhodohalobacter sulfatireducens]|uniref:ADP/GDP-polyphosphate phosphotransferase n=1 Tax=Rhodohalobacter sulfatireducens TaxID=2911366 RepID=A0ABS9KD87_9BACT|nr:polyphosphate kinase 2 [Rhodohalobacter sulfatireducens]MCG2588821.1 polyphosphate kinase 2 [Rhodohalobacter sulfatireducens]
MKLTDKEIELLNSKDGFYALLKRKKLNIRKSLKEAKYAHEMNKKQEEMIKLQSWVIENDKKVVIVFEGRDAAGKGGAIRRLTERINPRHFRSVALNIPSDDEQKQWFFQRYINQLPNPGEIVLFDRSWYNRAVVEPVNGFCTEEEYRVFMSQVNQFEKMLVQSNTYLVKFYFSITKKEQARRFKDIKKSPLKRWKMTAVDERAQDLWDSYTEYKEKMFEVTNSEHAPWRIIDANNKRYARLEAIKHILKTIPYE